MISVTKQVGPFAHVICEKQNMGCSTEISKILKHNWPWNEQSWDNSQSRIGRGMSKVGTISDMESKVVVLPMK